MNNKYIRGFALPTVLIASVIMMMVLLSGLVATTSISSSIKSNQHDKLAHLAAESGIEFMRQCFLESSPPSSGTYTPRSDSCNNPSETKPAAANWLIDTSNVNTAGTSAAPQPDRIRTTYSVAPPVSQGNGYYMITSTGILTVHRPNGSVERTYTKTLSLKLYYKDFVASQTTSGVGFVCAILSGKNWCWGTNAHGEHGMGVVDSTKIPQQTLRTNLKELEIDISGGNDFVCAITSDVRPNPVTGIQSDTSTNEVRCWGSQLRGQLGNGVDSATPIPYPITPNQRWITQTTPSQFPLEVASGGSHACVRTTDNVVGAGNLWCWGRNNHGQLGLNQTNSPSLIPYRAYTPAGDSTGVSVKYVVATNNNTCAIRTNDIALCWGDNEWGQTGTGSGIGNDVLIPSQVETGNNQLKLRVSDISIAGHDAETVAPNGGGHACAISTGTSGDSQDRAGQIYCWGSREYGAAESSISLTPIHRAYPVAIEGRNDYIAEDVSTSWRASCALVRFPTNPPASGARNIYCWGSNRNGELGVNKPPSDSTFTNGSTNVPQRLYVDPDPNSKDHFDIDDVVQLNKGGQSYRMCALANTHNYCWGRNVIGQIGDGTFDGDFTSDPLTIATSRFYPRLSVFAEPTDKGIIY